jgi:hypothetical protein
MKKVFAIALIAVSFAACNNSGDKKTDNTDTTKVDSPAVISPDTTTMRTDTTTVMPDTTHK